MPPSMLRLRLLALLAALLTVLLGLLMRFGLPGLAGDLAGSVCYVILLCWLLKTVRPRSPMVGLVPLATAVSVLVEVAQLTPVPAALAVRWPLLRVVLGTTFSPVDLVGLLLGAVVVLAGCRVARSLSRSGSRPDWPAPDGSGRDRSDSGSG